MKTYPAHIWQESNGSYSIEFPGLPGCFSSAVTLEESLVMAREALTGYLESLCSRKLRVPEPPMIQGKDIYAIQADAAPPFPAPLKQERQKPGPAPKAARPPLESAAV